MSLHPLPPTPSPLVYHLACTKCDWRIDWSRASGDPWPTACYYCSGKLKPVKGKPVDVVTGD